MIRAVLFVALLVIVIIVLLVIVRLVEWRGSRPSRWWKGWWNDEE